MTLEINRSPYFNDYLPDSNYTRVLFKDGAPIQSRELNNLQSMMQNQIRSFGDHVFKNGSRVSNARAVAVDYDYVIMHGINNWDGALVDSAIFQAGLTLKGRTTQLSAVVVEVKDLTLYVTYNGCAIDGETRTFIQGEAIDVYDSSNVLIYSFTVACPSCAESGDSSDTDSAIGKGTIFVLEEGIFYYNGMFVPNERQQLIISEHASIYETTVSLEIGLAVEELIVTAQEDESLYDNSLGYPNRRSPGADRHKVYLRLIKKEGDYHEGEGFISLAKFVSGAMITQKADSEYAEIMNLIAKRTFEESGNYALRPQDVRFAEHVALYYDGSFDNYVAITSPNTYYVNGFRSEFKNESHVVTPKARDTKKLPQYINQFDELCYILLKPETGTSAYACSPLPGDKVYDGSSIALYDGPVSNAGGGSFLPTGSQIGSIKVFDMSLESGVPGTGNAVYRYYIYNPIFVEGKSFANVKCAYHPTNKFIATPVFENGVVKMYNKGRSELIWRLKKSNIKSLRDSQAPERGSINIVKRAKLSGTLDSQGSILFSPKDDEKFVSLSKNSVCILTTNGVPATIDLNSITHDQTPSSIKLNLGQANSGKEIILITNVMVIDSKERVKRLLVHTDTLSNINASAQITLSKADVKRITKITAYPKLGLANVASHVPVDTALFDFNNGQTDVSYSNGWIKMKDGASYPTPVLGNESQYNVLIEYEYYEHSGKAGVLNVDSYTGTINSGDLTYSTIPAYKSASGTVYSLASCMDFRPLVVDGVSEAPFLPAMNTIATFDIEYYLPRTDIIQVDQYGSITTKLGISNDSPIPPKADADKMTLMELWLPAYTHNLEDIRFKRIENKRYTMRDIGRLASRLKKVEYYTVLNMLEKSASDLAVKDQDGYDRFKNGFIVDNFSSFQAADSESSEFRCAIDPSRYELRPTFGMRNRKLVLDYARSSKYQITNGIITLPYNSVLVDEQPFATKNISINPYFTYTQKGTVTLTPNVDTWTNTTNEPDYVITQDFGTDAYEGIANRLDKSWGSWSKVNRTTVSTSRTATAITTTTTTAASNPVSTDRTDSYNLGDRITSVELSTYMRSADIVFDCVNMAPSTQVYAFFEDKDVNEFCLPQGGRFGDPLITTAQGTLKGTFRIPDNTFRAGEATFKLTGDASNQDDPDTVITWAKNVYYSGGIDQTSQSITLNTITPTFNFTPARTTSTTQAVVSRAAVSTSNNSTQNNSGFSLGSSSGTSTSARSMDPVAQSFTLKTSGFISKLDIFLSAVDTTSDLIWVEIRTMENGYPTDIALARKEFKPEDLVTSSDSLTPQTVIFDNLVYVEGGVEYCFVVGGASPNTRIWVAQVGDKLINNPAQVVETQPSMGSSFRSQNGSTWNAEQYEDIKYNLYCAEFFEKEMDLVFKVQNEAEMLPDSALEFENGLSTIRVNMVDHAMIAGDNFSLNLFEGFYITVSAAPIINETLSTASGTAFVKSVIDNGSNWLVEISNLQGTLSGAFTTPTASGTIVTGLPADVMGVLVEDLSKTHVVVSSDYYGFTFTVASTATETGRYNGAVKVSANIAYNVINSSFSGLMYGCDSSSSFEGISYNPHSSANLALEYKRFEGYPVTIGNDHHLPCPYKLVTTANASKMDENVSSDSLLTLKVLSTDSFISPAIMADSFSATFITNRVGDCSTSMNMPPNSPRYVTELDASLGVEPFKYVSRKVTLSKPAADLYILVDAYKDDLADFDIYYRSASSSETPDVSAKPWIRIPVTKTSNSDSNKIEYEIILSEAFVTTWAMHDDISTFQVKIVGKTVNSSMPPVFSNLRIIAVT